MGFARRAPFCHGVLCGGALFHKGVYLAGVEFKQFRDRRFTRRNGTVSQTRVALQVQVVRCYSVTDRERGVSNLAAIERHISSLKTVSTHHYRTILWPLDAAFGLRPQIAG